MCQLSKQTTKLSNFSEKDTQRCDDCAAADTCIVDSSMCIKHIINPVNHRVKIIRRLKIKGSVKPIRRTRYMKYDLNEGVQSVNADRLVA
jgi:hypothetical protein